MTQKEIKKIVAKVVEMRNPYIENSIQYFVGTEARYIFNGDNYTKEELDAEYGKTAEKDIKNGYNDRMVGYYDKWYRYSRADEGRAYDEGVKMATQNPKCKAELNIIPCEH